MTGDGYDEVIDRAIRKALEQQALADRQRGVGRDLCEELLRVPPERRRLLIRNSARFRHPMLCETLLERSRDAGFTDPAQAVELARLALLAAETLGAGDCGGAECWNGLLARAWAQLGNAHRVSSDHREAEEAFGQVAARLEQGSVGLLDVARVLDLEASLRRDQRRFAEAAGLLDRVIDIYRELGQRNLLGRALKQKSMVCGEAGDVEAEMDLLQRALELLDPNEEPRSFLAARHNLITALNQSGRSREAFSLLFHTRPLYLRMGDRMNILRMRWLEGLVAVGLGRETQAETAFREVQEAFLEIGLDYDAALVSLDLAGVLIRQHRAGDVRQLAKEMLAVFRARDIHREALAALVFFCQAAKREAAGTALVEEVSGFLKRARSNPEIIFWNSAKIDITS
jgi:tetratricopeptide (TPR) repeat protein